MLSVLDFVMHFFVMLGAFILSVVYLVSHFCYAGCRYTKCSHAVRRFFVKLGVEILSIIVLIVVKRTLI
jgi:hypothetical protein